MNRRKISVIVAVIIIVSLVGLWPHLNYQRGKYSIYLAETGQLIISDEDIKYYSQQFHEIKLTPDGVSKIKALKVPTSGLPFKVKIGDEVVYTGAFWTALSSQSYSGIVINVLDIRDDIIKLEKGYPSDSFFHGEDPRGDPQIMSYLGKIGKLGP